jgi:uncharacterized membrane protein
MKKRGLNKLILTIVLITVFLINIISAVENNTLDLDRQEKIAFGHILKVNSIKTIPENLIPGEQGILEVKIENIADFPLYDIRMEINLPSQISFIQDTSKRQIYKMEATSIKNINFSIITLPSASEGVYNGSYNLQYVNHVGTEREETGEFGLLIKSEPKIFATVSNSEIYLGKTTGDITINFVNNDIANIKYLTVELLDSPDYTVLSDNKKYIGDLDSDDFDSIDFNLKVNPEKTEIPLLLKIEYRDSINTFYSKDLKLDLKIRDPKELGIKNNNAIYLIIIIVVAIAFVSYLYVKIKRKKK